MNYKKCLCLIILSSQIANAADVRTCHPNIVGQFFDLMFKKPDHARLVWDVMGTRSYDQYWSLGFQYLNKALNGNHGHSMPFYDESSIIKGRKTVLSLGESASNYIATLLALRQKVLGVDIKIENIHAVDIIYENPWIWIKDKRIRRKILKHLYTYPHNYHAHYFQNIELLDNQHGKMKFDEIISFYALDYVLATMNPNIDIQTRLETLSHILSYLKPGGVLRINGDRPLKNLVPMLYDFGGILDYSDPGQPWINIQTPYE